VKVKAKVILNYGTVKKIESAALKALPLTMESMKSEINNMQVVPKDTGNLEESIKVGVDNNKAYISYNTPYARKMYYHPEFNFRKDRNPNAQGRWLDTFIHGDKKKWLERAFAIHLKQNSGGVIK